MSKKNILILDNSVPAYDMSAGYRTADMYIDVFLDLGLNVTLFPLDFLKTEPVYLDMYLFLLYKIFLYSRPLI